MRLDIRYRLAFDYPEPVREAHNEIRVKPRDLPRQRLLADRLTCDPVARVVTFTDYWGNNVDHVGQTAEHSFLEIVAEAAVETRPTPELTSAPLSDLRSEEFYLSNIETLTESAHVELPAAIVEAGRDLVAGRGDVISAVAAVVQEVRTQLTYVSGSTPIGIPLTDLLAGGQGVCQDFSHLTIGLLRGAGVPARYVSGYLFAADETTLGSIDDLDTSSIEVQTHAWVEAAVPGQGWHAVDPTNDQPVGERHVIIGFGRDYDDVAPVRGVYVGESTPIVEAAVEMRRMEPMAKVLNAPTRPTNGRSPRVLPSVDPVVAQQQQQQQQ